MFILPGCFFLFWLQWKSIHWQPQKPLRKSNTSVLEKKGNLNHFLTSSSKSWLFCYPNLFRVLWQDCWSEDAKNLSRKLIWMSFPCVFRLIKWFYRWTGPSSSSQHRHFLKMIMKKWIRLIDVIWRKPQIPVLCLVGYGYSTPFELKKWSTKIRYATESILT